MYFFQKITKSKFILKQKKFHTFINAFSIKNKNKKNSCIVMHLTYILQQGRIKFHANQHKILLENGLNVVSPHSTTPLYNVNVIVRRFIQSL